MKEKLNECEDLEVELAALSLMTVADLRIPVPGACLSRVYREREHIIRVLDGGFEYAGRRYRSLSAIAKVITGAHWNGMLFFGLTRQRRRR